MNSKEYGETRKPCRARRDKKFTRFCQVDAPGTELRPEEVKIDVERGQIWQLAGGSLFFLGKEEDALAGADITVFGEGAFASGAFGEGGESFFALIELGLEGGEGDLLGGDV